MLGAGLLWTSLIYVGAICSIKLKNRVSTIRKTIVMLEEMKMLLRYLNIPIYEMLIQISEKSYLSELSYISACILLMSEGADFPVAWKNAVTSASPLYKREEIDKLLQLGENLGTSNIENQIRILDMQISCFTLFLQNAQELSKRYSTMAVTLSALIGCMIFILII